MNTNPWTAEPGALSYDRDSEAPGVSGPGYNAVERLLESLRRAKQPNPD